MRFYNSASREIEEFVPLQPGRAGLYTCGPTVWNYAHVGNLRTFVFYDLLRRHLRFHGYQLTHVLNLTDVEDRIIRRAAEAGQNIRDYVAPFETAFMDDLATLRVEPPEVVTRATENIPQMVEMVARLLESGHAYQADGDVYYRVESFPDYGRLAHLDRAGLRSGARVNQDDYDKEDVVDFALWKGEGPGDAAVGAAWEAPFGRGRPGWHIECSAMSKRFLGPTFDIHAGGVDLLFPHHQNEVAQSEAANGAPMARYWLHAAHLADATGAKMSKRLGNIATLGDLLDEGHDPVAVRYFLATGAHYRARLNFDEGGLRAAGEQVRRLREFARRLTEAAPADAVAANDADAVPAERLRQAFRAALDEDLNLPQASGHLFEAVRLGNAAIDRGRVDPATRAALEGLLADADRHLDILRDEELQLDAEVERLIAEREAARAGRDFARADEIRARLHAAGIELQDTAQGVRWRRLGPAR